MQGGGSGSSALQVLPREENTALKSKAEAAQGSGSQAARVKVPSNGLSHFHTETQIIDAITASYNERRLPMIKLLKSRINALRRDHTSIEVQL